jgi:DNA polymerase III sliding clamp (beta) subunit (PCNA family)
MIRINRPEFLQQLESVQPGLEQKGGIEQAKCFAFQNGQVRTFNDEVACRAPSGLPKEVTGAVLSKQLLDILRKMSEDEVEVDFTDHHMVIKGKKKKTGVNMQTDVFLPYDKVEKPDSWRDLPDDFADAVRIVQECTSKDESEFVATCVHVHPKWVEATDGVQLIRYRIRTSMVVPMLIRQAAVKHVLDLDMTRVAETENWVHFRNPSKLVVSLRRYQFPESEGFPDIGARMKAVSDGSPIRLPQGLISASERAAIFSSENKDKDKLLVTLTPGNINVRGEGAYGFYQEDKKIKYEGEEMEFLVSPKLLIELTKKYPECGISANRLKVDGGKFTYVTCLGKVKPKEGE